jgi:hypothetical protein
MKNTGFKDVTFRGYTGIKNSGFTEGALFYGCR